MTVNVRYMDQFRRHPRRPELLITANRGDQRSTRLCQSHDIAADVVNRTGVAGQQLNPFHGFPQEGDGVPATVQPDPSDLHHSRRGNTSATGVSPLAGKPGVPLCLSSGLWLRSGDTGSVAFVGEHEPPKRDAILRLRHLIATLWVLPSLILRSY